MDILVKDLEYSLDPNLEVYREVDILIRREDDGGVSIHRGRNLLEKFNLDRRDLKIIDGNKKCAIPGLSNNHTHIPMTLLRGIADDMILEDWLREKIWPNEMKLTGEDVYYGALLGCLEMLRFGVTSFNDMYFFPEEIIRATKEVGIKG
ncbi:MAG TPA: amidohydrolase, partial [Methanothermococcus okinawensis]|nr:amidohydrolase [Methanothermococcus okinawensis]